MRIISKAHFGVKRNPADAQIYVRPLLDGGTAYPGLTGPPGRAIIFLVAEGIGELDGNWEQVMRCKVILEKSEEGFSVSVPGSPGVNHESSAYA